MTSNTLTYWVNGTITLANGQTRRAITNGPVTLYTTAPVGSSWSGSQREATVKQAATFVADSWVTDVEAAHERAEIENETLICEASVKASDALLTLHSWVTDIEAAHAEAMAYEVEQAAVAYGAALTDDTAWAAATPGTATYFGAVVPARYSTAADALWLYRPVYDTGVVGWARVFIAAQTFVADSWVTDVDMAHDEALTYLTGWQADEFVSGTVLAYPFESDQRYPARLYSDGRLTVAVGWRTYGTDEPRYESLAAVTLRVRTAIVASWAADTDPASTAATDAATDDATDDGGYWIDENGDEWLYGRNEDEWRYDYSQTTDDTNMTGPSVDWSTVYRITDPDLAHWLADIEDVERAHAAALAENAQH